MTTHDTTNDSQNDKEHPDNSAEASVFLDGRIGPKMRLAVSLLGKRDYKSKNQLAKAIGPNGSQQYGYRTVNRLLQRGFITVEPDHPDASPTGQGAVVLTEKGERYRSYITPSDSEDR